MRKVCNKNVIIRFGIILSITAVVWILLAAEERFDTAVSFFHKIEKAAKQEPPTSTGYRHPKEFKRTLERYRRFASLYHPKLSTAVPGLEATDVLGESCDRMVPQGICIAGEYMLITAYDGTRADAGKGRQNAQKPNRSVMYVLSNQDPANRRLLTTIVLPDVNHVGGVTFDGKDVWIAKSTTYQCSMISYEVIQKAAALGQSSYELLAYDQNVSCGAVASFVTFYKGRLWVGTYKDRGGKYGALRSYDIIKEKKRTNFSYRLQKREEIVIPKYANGVEFLECGGRTYMTVTTSKGRYFDSKIYFYNIFEDPMTGRTMYYRYNCCEFPPMAEELVCDEENTYFLFESSASCYSAQTYWKCSYPVDRICALSTMELFLRNQGAGYASHSAGVFKLWSMLAFDDVWQERKYWQQYGGTFLV